MTAAPETRWQAIIGGIRAALTLGPPLIYLPRTAEQRFDEVGRRIERAHRKVAGDDRSA